MDKSFVTVPRTRNRSGRALEAIAELFNAVFIFVFLFVHPKN